MNTIMRGLALAIVVCSGAAAGPLCGTPAPRIQIPDRGPRPPNVDGESIVFSFASQSYPVDIYSGFALQGAGSGYCIRYEAENKGPGPVQKFYWPLATFEMDAIPQGQRQSIAITKLGGQSPVIEETWVYGFLSGAAKSYAYQKHALARPPSRDGRLRLAADFTAMPMRIADVDEPSTRHLFKEPESLPQIGSQFLGSDSEVRAGLGNLHRRIGGVSA